MSAAVGADVESICSKCGDVWHVVVAKVGEQIVKVHCKQCGKEHRHKPPGAGAKAAAKTGAPARTSTARPKTAKGRSKTGRPATLPAGPPPFDPSRPPKPYKPLEPYSIGDRIAHPTFGAGIVESSPGPGKVQVWFDSGRRVLAMAKPASMLERPDRPPLPPRGPEE